MGEAARQVRPAPSKRPVRPVPGKPPDLRLVPTSTPYHRPPPPSLWKPSAKFAAALVGLLVFAVALGSALGLPSPFTAAVFGEAGSTAAISGSAPVEQWDANTLVGAGTAPVLDLGPFHPVAGKVSYGEADARFGASRSGHTHAGQDVFAAKGTPLVAVSNGIVTASAGENDAFSSGRGNYIAIYDPELDRSYAYLHLLKRPTLRTGDRVRAGQPVGLMGCSGSCYGVHLHFEIRQGRATVRSDTRAIDPLPFLRSLPRAPTP